MTIESILAGRWAFLVEESPYARDAPDVLSFRDGVVSNEDGELGPYRISGNTVFAPLGENVELVINPSDNETGVEAHDIHEGADTIQANLRTSFDDGSDDLIEYATLTRLG